MKDLDSVMMRKTLDEPIYNYLKKRDIRARDSLFATIQPLLRRDRNRLKELLKGIVESGAQENIISDLEKGTGNIKRAYATSQEQIDSESKELRDFRRAVSTVALSESIAYHKSLSFTQPGEYNRLVNKALNELFKELRAAQEESNCDPRIIGAIVEDYSHFLIRRLYSVTHYKWNQRQDERFMELNRSLGDAYAKIQKHSILVQSEKDETRKAELLAEGEVLKTDFDRCQGEMTSWNDYMYDEAFQDIDLSQRIADFLGDLKALPADNDSPL